MKNTPSTRISSDKGATPSFVKPFLHALGRMQERETLLPAQVTDRARMLLVDRLGAEGQMPEAAFSHGSIGIIADHTTYFDGFALVLRLKQGLAVALRRTSHPRSRFVVSGSDRVHEFDIRALPDGGSDDLLRRIVARADGDGHGQFDLALVATMPADLGPAYDASFSVAMFRALHAFRSETPDDDDLEIEAEKVLSDWMNGPVSGAYPIAAASVAQSRFLLIDTRTRERLALDAPGHVEPGWGFIWFPGESRDPEAINQRRRLADQAFRDVHAAGFSELKSLRDLEHRDLDKAIDLVPRRSRSVLKHLVTENRNVQKLVGAIRRTDWQFFGALMMISQASKASDWNTTSKLHMTIVREAEQFVVEGGIHGVIQTGEGPRMLVLGQPFSVPAFLDRIKESVAEHTNEPIGTFIL